MVSIYFSIWLPDLIKFIICDFGRVFYTEQKTCSELDLHFSFGIVEDFLFYLLPIKTILAEALPE
jgi:hypothetical protein